MNLTTNGVAGAAPEARLLWGWKDVLLIGVGTVLLIALGFGGLVLVARLASLPREGENLLLASLAIVGLEFVAIGVSVYIFGLRRRHLTWAEIGFRPVSFNWILVAILVALIAQPVSAVLALLTYAVLGLAPNNPQAEAIAPAGFSWLGLIGMTLLGGVLVPIAEETLFRGVLYRWLRNRWGTAMSAIFSALLFAIVHGALVLIPVIFVLGVVLALLYERSKSLWPGSLVHMIYNSTSIVLLYLALALGIQLPGV